LATRIGNLCDEPNNKKKAQAVAGTGLKEGWMREGHKASRAETQAHLRVVASDDDRRQQQQIHLANHIASLGGRHVLEAMRAVRRGQTIQSVLEDFQTLPRWRGMRVVGVTR
jgi:hypothetical protein